jgi:bacterioferritin-associated ferredoxin
MLAATGADVDRRYEVVSDCLAVVVAMADVVVAALLEVATVVDVALKGELVAITPADVTAGIPEASIGSACGDCVITATTSATAATAATATAQLSAFTTNETFAKRRNIPNSQHTFNDMNRIG